MGLKLRNRFFRALFFLVGDLVSILVSIVGAKIAFELANVSYGGIFISFHPLALLGSFILGLASFRMYQVSWRYTSLRDLIRIFGGLGSGLLLYLAGSYLAGAVTDTLLLFGIVTYVQSFFLIGAFRVSRRVYWEVFRSPSSEENVIVFGAGNACDQILRDIMRNNNWELNVSAIFDDNKDLKGINIHGVKVHGNSYDMYDYLKNNYVSQLIVAAPSIPKKRLKEIINQVKKIDSDLTIKVIPSFHRLSDDPIGVRNIRDIRIEDILGRESASVDMMTISDSIRMKTVLVTGAGGSIGSEIIRQCINLEPKQLVALDIDETELYRLENELDRNVDQEIETIVADVSDKHKIESVIKEYHPDVVFHAAAYKHVPMMERFPEEAIKVNIKGTQTLASVCCEYNVPKFVLISTDKAVNPTNVMGATKRVAEQICMAYNDFGITRFISVRFGNVLGSRGSVVPLFMEQINNGGPVTITDPEIERYFMTIPEAVLLVMQAGSMGEGGEVFVLDMGEPVKILDMAKELIRLNGLEPEKDIPLVFKGLRPGEKMYEELLNTEEGAVETKHEQIYKANCSVRFTSSEIDSYISSLIEKIADKDYETLRYYLKEAVPTYKFNGELEEVS